MQNKSYEVLDKKKLNRYSEHQCKEYICMLAIPLYLPVLALPVRKRNNIFFKNMLSKYNLKD